jgi:uncharacterized protein (DUF983 family)
MKRCGNCGHELPMRSFRLLDDTCPHCGEFRHSKASQSAAAKIQWMLYVLSGCVAMNVLLGVSLLLSTLLIGLPFCLLIWIFYNPVADQEEVRGPRNENSDEPHN